MLLKKLNTYFEQVATYLQKDNKLQSSSTPAASDGAGATVSECDGIMVGDACPPGGAALTTTEVLGPDSPETSLANTYKVPPPHEKGRAGLDTNDIKPAMIPAIPLITINNKKRKRKRKIK